jgi:hypothetical protein
VINNQGKMNRFVLTSFLLVGGALNLTLPRNHGNDIKCEVVSVKIMSDEESTKVAGRDFIGADVLVRFRLSTPRRSISFYGTNYDKKPIGHRTKWFSDGKMCVYPLGAKETKNESPGIGDLANLGLPMSWFSLGEAKSIEFEVLDGTSSAGEKHGASAFVKFPPDETPVEVFSESYTVPARP